MSRLCVLVSNKSKLGLLVALIIASSLAALLYCSSSPIAGLGFTVLYQTTADRTTDPPARSCNASARAEGGFLTASFGQCYGLGNVLWRYASLRAIAAQLNRTAYFPPLQCLRSYMKELEEVFPNFSKDILLMNPPNGAQVHRVHFADVNCCEFEDPQTSLLCNDAVNRLEYVQLTANYLQSPHFFHHDPALRTEVLRSYECAPTTTAKMDRVAEKVRSQADAHLLCMHIRRGDFIGKGWESRPEFIRASLTAAIDYLTSLGQLSSGNSTKPLSVLLLGDDRKFNGELIPTLLKSSPSGKIDYRLVPEGIKRGEELCLAVHHCDSLVITSHASTYAWWVGYLMRERSRLETDNGDNGPSTKQVFYKAEKNEREVVQRRNFPDDWVPMRLRMLLGQP